MTLPETLILVLYFFVLSVLAIYCWHRYYLVYLYMKNKGKAPQPFELCLELKEGDRVMRLYSRNDWIVDGGKNVDDQVEKLRNALPLDAAAADEDEGASIFFDR